MVGGEAWAGETLRQECGEGLGGKLTGWTTEAWVTSGRWSEKRGEERRGETLKRVKDINEEKKTEIMKIH